MEDVEIDEQPRSDAASQASSSSTQQPDGPKGQQESADVGRADGQTGATSATAVSQSLQEQIAQAIQPIVSDLRQQITQNLQQQMEQGQGQESGAPEGGGLQAALAQTTTAIQQAFAWVRQMATTIIETVREWIEKVIAAIRRLALSVIAQGIKAAAKPLLSTAVNKGAEMVQDQGKQRLESVRQRLPGSGQAPQTATATAAG